MPALSFRNRILLALLLLGAVPSAFLSVGLVVVLLRSNPARSTQAALEPVMTSGRALLEGLDTTRMSPREHRVLHDHVRALNTSLTLSRRGFYYSRYKTLGLALVVSVLGVLLLYSAVLLARSLSRQLALPIDELVGWMGRIRRHDPLPPEEARRGAPEFAVLRTALHETAASLELARASELESERLRAFREVARRVAHEMKNPLTPVRFAIGQLGRSSLPEQQEALEVLRAETARLEQLAKDFANLGRLPEGPAAEVDLGELLGELLHTSVPAEMRHTLQVKEGTPHILGHYDPLRRAFGNLIRNAVEASRSVGTIEAFVSPDGDGVRVAIADHGPGVATQLRSRIFEPYVTDKVEGTGLGLAIVKQAVELHHGTVEVSPTQGGGATFIVRLPRSPDVRQHTSPPQPAAERRVADRRRRTP
jgi:two-component system, NtrC family, nitrogen regulation sensor histidine kinase NtrY